MGDQVLITGRCLRKIADAQRERMITPDVLLHTRNVMIPVAKSVPLKQSFNVPSSGNNKLQILRAQNYRNNPALLFSETPIRTLYNQPLEDLFKVRRLNSRKFRNQNAKQLCTVPKKTNFPKKRDILQNLCSLKEAFSYKKKSTTLHFPNTVSVRFQSSKQDESLHRISSRSIKLSRKDNLLQRKETQIKYVDEFVSLPRTETPIDKPSIISLQSQFTDTISTVSMQSILSFQVKNEKTHNRLVSNHLQPTNSELEINVLHYEDDNLLENNLPQSHINSADTNWSSINDIKSIKMQDEITRDIKYSRQVNNWMPSSSHNQNKEYNNEWEVKNIERYDAKPYDCKIKYSWQVIGTSTQTSCSLLQDLLNNNEDNKSAYKMCKVKYSWQIIGISTQAALDSYNDEDYWTGMLLTPNKNYNENEASIDNNETKLQDYSRKKLKRYLILNNQQTQTFAEKEVQADTDDCNAKYSWHNLLKQYIYGRNFRSTG